MPYRETPAKSVELEEALEAREVIELALARIVLARRGGESGERRCGRPGRTRPLRACELTDPALSVALRDVIVLSRAARRLATLHHVVQNTITGYESGGTVALVAAERRETLR